MMDSAITNAVFLRWNECSAVLSQLLTKLLQRPVRLRSVVEDYDYWCVVSESEPFTVTDLQMLLSALHAVEADFPCLLPEDSTQTRSFSVEFSRALLRHALQAIWRYEHLTEDFLILIDVKTFPAYRLFSVL